MKFTIKLLTVLVFLLATFSPQTTASAKTYRFRTADYYLSTYDASTCIGSYIEFEVGEELLPSLQIYRYDRCQNQSLMEAYGRKWLTNSEFKFSGNLDSATLRTTVPMYDYVTDSTFDVWVDITWTGTGEIHSSRTHDTYEPSPGCFVNRILVEEYRSASASGTISDGTTNFTPEPADQANLYFAQRTETSHGCD